MWFFGKLAWLRSLELSKWVSFSQFFYFDYCQEYLGTFLRAKYGGLGAKALQGSAKAIRYGRVGKVCVCGRLAWLRPLEVGYFFQNILLDYWQE